MSNRYCSERDVNEFEVEQKNIPQIPEEKSPIGKSYIDSYHANRISKNHLFHRIKFDITKNLN